MKNSAFLAIAVASPLVLGSTVTLASEDEICTSAPRSDWRSVDDVRAAAEALGYKDIRRVKVDDGCYEAYASDKDGRRVEVYFDPVSLKIVRVEDD